MKSGVIFIFMLILLVASVSAYVEFPHASNSDRPTLGYPRWKVFMDPNDSNNLWALIASSTYHLYYSNNGGQTWNYGFDVTDNLDFHVSMDGDDNGDLFFTYPPAGSSSHGPIYLNKISYPVLVPVI